MTSQNDAWAGLAEDVGKALLLFAERLRAMPEPTVGQPSPRVATRDGNPAAGLGTSQLKVLTAVREAGETGMTAYEVAQATGLKDTNTPNILRSLQGRGLVAASNTKPTLWLPAQDV